MNPLTTQISRRNGLIVQTPRGALPDPNCGAIACADLAWEPTPLPALSGDAPDGVVDEAYAFIPTVTDGVSPLVFDGTTDAPGLEVDPALGLTGTPTEDGTFSATMTVTDANGHTSAPYTFPVVIELP